MTKPPVRLSNCYVPLAPTPEGNKDEKAKRESGDGKTTRASHSLRRLIIDSDVMPSAAGSALVELGHTKVICQVIGPITASSNQVPPSVQLNMDEGTLYCEVKYAAHVGYPTSALVASNVTTLDQSGQQLSSSRVNSWTMAREADLSSRLLTALSPAVPLKQYPKCALLVKAIILQDDGCALPACIAAASLALTNAAVEVYDLVTSCSVAVCRDGTLLADPDLEEEQGAEALVTLAVLPSWKEVSLWEQSGKLTPEVGNEAIHLCRDGCRTMQRFLRDHLLYRHEEEK